MQADSKAVTWRSTSDGARLPKPSAVSEADTRTELVQTRASQQLARLKEMRGIDHAAVQQQDPRIRGLGKHINNRTGMLYLLC